MKRVRAITATLTLTIFLVLALSQSAFGASTASLSSMSVTRLEQRLDWQIQRLRLHRTTIRWHLTRGVVAPRGRPAVGTPRYRVWWNEQAVKWTSAEVAETRSTLQAKLASVLLSALPAHHALWTCIHDGEAAWGDHDSGGNGHYGGLQMYPGWLGYFTGTADQFSQAQQEQFAEQGYRDSRYSRAWLEGQWGQTIGPCWGYAE